MLQRLCCADVFLVFFTAQARSARLEALEKSLADEYQPFTKRDRAVAKGLLQRPEVEKDESLKREVLSMLEGSRKLEIEALHSFGPTALIDYLVEKVILSLEEPQIYIG